MGAPISDSLIDHSRYWHVPMTAGDTLAWLQARPPAGLTPEGESSGDGPNGFGYTEPDSTSWVQASLDVGVSAADGGGADIRADGYLLWLDPKPQVDDSPGARVTLTVTAGCPPTIPYVVGARSEGNDLDVALLPSAVPTGALVCSDAGQGGPVAQERLDGPAAVRLASLVAAVPLSHTDNTQTNCPNDDGSATVLAFGYPGRPDVTLWYARTGCGWVGNGHIRASPSGPFVDFVQSLPGAR